jgi:hypothetical protein
MMDHPFEVHIGVLATTFRDRIRLNLPHYFVADRLAGALCIPLLLLFGVHAGKFCLERSGS